MFNWLAKLFGRRVIYLKSNEFNTVRKRWAKPTEFGLICNTVYYYFSDEDHILCYDDGTTTDRYYSTWTTYRPAIKSKAQLLHEKYNRGRPVPPRGQVSAVRIGK